MTRFVRCNIWMATMLCLSPVSDAAQAGSKWEYITQKEGIIVSSRQVKGRDFPTFRGVGVVEADIYAVLAVLSDVNRHKQWIDRCSESYLLRKVSETERLVYARTDAPWPASDRDAVYHSTVTADWKAGVVSVVFRAVRSKLKPPVSGVVRMTRLRGHSG